MAQRSDDYIVRLRANNADLKRKLLDSRNSLKSYNSSVNRIGSSVSKSMMMMFGAGVGIAAIGGAIRKIADFEYQMDKVAAVSRASADEVEKLTNNALELGARSKYTATEIGKLQEELARLGFTTDQIVAMTDASRKLATVADTELGPTAKAVGQIINSFGFEAKEATRVANVMAESFSMTALNLEEFTTGMAYAATAGKSAGFTLEEVTAMLGKLVDNGIQGSKAGTALRDIFADLSIKGMTLDEAFKQINSSTNKNATAFELFGKVSMNAAVILAEQKEKVSDLTASFADNNQEMVNMANVMEDNLMTDWQLFTSAIDGFVQKEGSELNSTLRETVQFLTIIAGHLNKVMWGLKLIADIRPGGGDSWKKLFSDIYEEYFNLKTKLTGLTGPTLDIDNSDWDELLKDIIEINKNIEDSTKSFKKYHDELSTLSNLPAIGFEKFSNDGFGDFNLDGLDDFNNELADKLKLDYGVEFEKQMREQSIIMDQAFEEMDFNAPIQKMNELMEASSIEITEIWGQLGNAISMAIDGMFSTLEAAVAGDKGIDKMFVNLFASLLKSAGSGFVNSGIQHFAAAAILKAKAAIANAVRPGAGAVYNAQAVAQKAQGSKNIGIGIGMGAAGSIIGGLSSRGSGGGSGGGASSSSGNIKGQSGRGSTAPDVIYLKLKGNELQATIDMNDRRKQRTG